MNFTFCDIIEVSSPWMALVGCCIRMKKYGKDNITLLSFFTFLAIVLLNSYAVYLGSNRQNNIMVYTLEHFLMLSSFSYISFELIKKKIPLFFISNIFIFLIIFYFEKNSFDSTHSINPLLSGFFSYILTLCGLTILVFLAKNKSNIKSGYYQFSIWFAAALIIYFVSIFLLYTFFDYLQLLNEELTDRLWKVSVYGLLTFFLLLFVAYTHTKD